MPFDDVLADFHTQLQALGPRGRGMRYPHEFIEFTSTLVSLLREHGWRQQTIAQTLGISWPTLLRWSSAPCADPPGFVPIQLLSPAPLPADAASTLTLVSPTGWRLEGLELELALHIMATSPC